jgi:hypothetical protein
MSDITIEKAYELAGQRYNQFGIDTDAAIAQLEKISISLIIGHKEMFGRQIYLVTKERKESCLMLMLQNRKRNFMKISL